jgi:hypothetical protein
LQISKETVTELENIPNIDLEKLTELSNEYLSLVTSVKSSLLEKSRFIRPYHPYGQGNYALKREVEISEAALRISESFVPNSPSCERIL